MWLLLVNTYGNRPIKLLNRIKKKILIKMKIVPWIAVSPKTAFNSFSKKKMIFENVFENWDLDNQYICGIKNKPTKIDTQLIIIW